MRVKMQGAEPIVHSLAAMGCEAARRVEVCRALHLAAVVVRVVQRCVGGGDDLRFEPWVRPAQVKEHHRLRQRGHQAGTSSLHIWGRIGLRMRGNEPTHAV